MPYLAQYGSELGVWIPVAPVAIDQLSNVSNDVGDSLRVSWDFWFSLLGLKLVAWCFLYLAFGRIVCDVFLGFCCEMWSVCYLCFFLL